MENFDPEMLFEPNEEKIRLRNEIIDKSVLSFGVQDNEKILHFGCGSREKSFLGYIRKFALDYKGIDIDSVLIDSCISDFDSEKFSFEISTMQSFIDKDFESNFYDWIFIDGLLNKNLYENNQYDFIDTIIRKCIYNTKNGLIIFFDGKNTKNDNSYNIDFLCAFIHSIYNRYTIIRLNEYQYLCCIYKYYV